MCFSRKGINTVSKQAKQKQFRDWGQKINIYQMYKESSNITCYSISFRQSNSYKMPDDDFHRLVLGLIQTSFKTNIRELDVLLYALKHIW